MRARLRVALSGQDRAHPHTKDEGGESEEPRSCGRDGAVARRGAIDVSCAKRPRDVLCELLENVPLAANDCPRRLHGRHEGGKDNANGDSPANEEKSCSQIAIVAYRLSAGWTEGSHGVVCELSPMSLDKAVRAGDRDLGPV